MNMPSLCHSSSLWDDYSPTMTYASIQRLGYDLVRDKDSATATATDNAR
jgi:hypothetical protein